ncbi:MAG: hypothetical protein GEV04_02225 [Actinophytocola sp.]|nr:hypothetical protein [Actinophytocola sp.]
MRAPHVRTRRVLAAAAATLFLTSTGCQVNTHQPAGAQFNRPVDLVVPFGPGGGADAVARSASNIISERIGVDVPVINVDGATGSSGTVRMLSANAGQSMSVLIQDTLATVSAGRASFQFDEIKAVCRLQSMPSALMVRKDTYANWQELADAARANPGKLKVATVGASSVDDIVLAATEEVAGTRFRAVPFSEPSERYAALLGGQVDVLYEQLGDVREYLDSGDFVPVLTVADEPVDGYADVPSTSDIGIPESVVLPQFRGLVMSADAPQEIVDQMSSACRQASESRKFAAFQEEVYATDDSYQNAAEFQRFLEDQDKLITSQLREYDMLAD